MDFLFKGLVEGKQLETWHIELTETGMGIVTGRRFNRWKAAVGTLCRIPTFVPVCGDGASNVNLSDPHEFRMPHRKCVTVTTVRVFRHRCKISACRCSVRNCANLPA